MKDILVAICTLLCMGAFIMIIGTAGAIDQNIIEMSEGTGRLIKYTILFVITAIIIIKVSNEDEKSERSY